MIMNQGDYRPVRDLFHAIYFIHQQSGVLLFIRSFDEDIPNPDLVSGLISAINSFASSISKNRSPDALHSINMDDIRILYTRKNSLLSVAISRNIDANEEQATLNYFAQEFYRSYQMYIENFVGNIDPFQGFQKKLESFEEFITNARFRELSNKIDILKNAELTPLPSRNPRSSINPPSSLIPNRINNF